MALNSLYIRCDLHFLLYLGATSITTLDKYCIKKKLYVLKHTLSRNVGCYAGGHLVSSSLHNIPFVMWWINNEKMNCEVSPNWFSWRQKNHSNMIKAICYQCFTFLDRNLWFPSIHFCFGLLFVCFWRGTWKDLISMHFRYMVYGAAEHRRSYLETQLTDMLNHNLWSLNKIRVTGIHVRNYMIDGGENLHPYNVPTMSA